ASQYAGKALEVLGDAVRHPKFRPEDLETERRVIAEEVAAERLEPDRVVIAQLFRMAFPSHPYGNDVLGSPEAVGQMSRSVVQQFFADEYTPSNATVVIVGDVDGSAVVSQVRTAFGVGQTPGAAVLSKMPVPDPPPVARRETIQRESREAFL